MGNGPLEDLNKLMKKSEELTQTVNQKIKEFCEYLTNTSTEERIEYFEQATDEDIDGFCEKLQLLDKEYYEILAAAKEVKNRRAKLKGESG